MIPSQFNLSPCLNISLFFTNTMSGKVLLKILISLESNSFKLSSIASLLAILESPIAFLNNEPVGSSCIHSDVLLYQEYEEVINKRNPTIATIPNFFWASFILEFNTVTLIIVVTHV